MFGHAAAAQVDKKAGGIVRDEQDARTKNVMDRSAGRITDANKGVQKEIQGALMFCFFCVIGWGCVIIGVCSTYFFQEWR